MNFEDIKEDIQLVFHDLGAGADALINRLKAVDRDTIKTIIASRRDMSEEDAEKMIQDVENVRDETIEKAERMKERVEQKLSSAQKEAAKIAEQTRKNVAVAAWWSVGTAVFSSIASVLGKIIALGMYS